MRKELPFVTTILVTALALESCNAFEPKSVKAAPLNQTPVPTLPQPVEEPVVAIATPVIPETPMEILPVPTEIQPYLYFSQNGFGDETVGARNKKSNRPKAVEVGCALAVGGMATRINPDIYLRDFYNYFKSIGKYGPARISENGSDIEDHLAVLESLGYTPVELSTPGSTLDEVKAKIKESTSNGIPVWINADFYHKGHHSMAVGIAPNGDIIFNDPLYGQGKEIPDSKISAYDDKGNTLWKVYAIIPPAR